MKAFLITLAIALIPGGLVLVPLTLLLWRKLAYANHLNLGRALFKLARRDTDTFRRSLGAPSRAAYDQTASAA